MVARTLGRRDALVAMLTTAVLPGVATAQNARRSVLLIGWDIADAKYMDPARATEMSAYMPLRATYEALVTMPPGDYSRFTPLLATEWAPTADGRGLRFRLREGVKFASGNLLTANDVKFTYERVNNLKDQPALQFTTNIAAVNIVDDHTVDILFKDAGIPMLGFIGSPQLAIQDSKEVMAHGGTSAANADTTDTGTLWLDQSSAGTGPYRITKWARKDSIELARNQNYWRGAVPFERVIIRHMPENSVQQLAVEKGDIDLAFNLNPEQIEVVAKNPDINIVRKSSLDYMYMTLTSSAELNPALAKQAARQAVACAIDYDGIRDSLLKGAAIRPLNFIPVGMGGSSEDQARQFGYREDLNRARALLAQAGLPNGFSFELQYGAGDFASVSYQLLAEKVQADLKRVGIVVALRPMDAVNFRTQFMNGKSTSVLTYWTGNMDVSLWALPAIERVANRVHWQVPGSLTDLCHQALREPDIAKQQAMWLRFQRALTEQCNYIVLFQPLFQVAARRSVTDVDLTAIGGVIEMGDVKPA